MRFDLSRYRAPTLACLLLCTAVTLTVSAHCESAALSELVAQECAQQGRSDGAVRKLSAAQAVCDATFDCGANALLKSPLPTTPCAGDTCTFEECCELSACAKFICPAQFTFKDSRPVTRECPPVPGLTTEGACVYHCCESDSCGFFNTSWCPPDSYVTTRYLCGRPQRPCDYQACCQKKTFNCADWTVENPPACFRADQYPAPPDKQCSGVNGCTSADCCPISKTCATYRCQLQPGWVAKKNIDLNKTCTLFEGGCVTRECCDATVCTEYTRVVGCKSGYIPKQPISTAKCPGTKCDNSDCCKKQKTCQDWRDDIRSPSCKTGYEDKDNLSKISCGSKGCSTSLCCKKATCGNFKCPSKWTKRKDISLTKTCKNSKCTKEQCCDPTNCKEFISARLCRTRAPGYIEKSSPDKASTDKCSSGRCDVKQCCVRARTCKEWIKGFYSQCEDDEWALIKPPSTKKCKDSVCDWRQCCVYLP